MQEELKLESPLELEVGDVLKLDTMYYQIIGKDVLYYQFQVTTSTVSAGGSTNNVNVKELTPQNNEIFYIDSIGISGAVSVQPQYPAGNNRGTPALKVIYLDERYAPSLDPMHFGIFVVYPNYPGLNISAPIYWNGNASVWFFGRKFKVRVITKEEANELISSGSAKFYSAVSAYA